MNERTDLERTLAAWLSAEAPRGVPGDLLGGVFATTRASGPWPTWRALLSVAPMRTQSRVLAGSPTLRTARTVLVLALIATLLAAAGILVAGSGLLRPPPDRSPVLGDLGGCTAELPTGQLMELTFTEEGLADPTDGWGPPNGTILRVYDDGLLLVGRDGRTTAEIAAGESGITMRRLTPEGVRLVREAIEESGVMSGVMGGCHERYATRPYRGIAVRSEGGGVTAVRWGHVGAFTVRVMTSAELEAADEFERKLLDLESWLPTGAWADATVRSYADRWEVNVQLPDLLGLADPEAVYETPLPLPEAETFDLPGSVPLLAFGKPYQEPDGAKASGQPGLHGRCSVIGTEEAHRLTEAFGAANAEPFNGNWWFRHGPGLVAVAIRPLLPTEDGCTARTLGLAESPGPTPTPLPAPSGDLAAVDPCQLFTRASIAAAMGASESDVWSGALPARDRATLPRSFGLDFRTCAYDLPETWDDTPVTVLVHLRTSGVDSSQARDLALEILGEEATDETLRDRTLWRSTCPALLLSSCSPAFAVSAEPYLVVVTFTTWPWPGWGYTPPRQDWPAIGRVLAVAMEIPE